MDFASLSAALMKRRARRVRHSWHSVRAALARLGNPQNNLKLIHVTGTNGKGSVARLCALSLEAASLKTGLFVSPHLINLRERISINGTDISEEDFVSCARAVAEAEPDELTFFETLTCAAFVYFAKNGCDFVVLEAGIGGLHDVTNIISRPEVAVITSVGLDHMDLLGGTPAAIAAEKAGIIKPGGVCVCGEMDACARAAVEAAAKANGARLVYAPEAYPFRFEKLDWARRRTLFSVPEGGTRAIAALGRHYAGNAATVFAVLAELRGLVPALTPELVYSVFEGFGWPARFELFNSKSGGIIIVDGAHNPQAAAAFADTFTLSPYRHTQGRALVTALMGDKDYRGVLERIAPLFDKIITTQTGAARALPAAELAVIARDINQKAEVAAEPDPAAALKLAMREPVCAVAGSFYLAGIALNMLENRAA